MEYRQLGSSGFKVPVLSLGTGTFGGQGAFKGFGETDATVLKRARRNSVLGSGGGHGGQAPFDWRSASAPPTISMISVVMVSWRARFMIREYFLMSSSAFSVAAAMVRCRAVNSAAEFHGDQLDVLVNDVVVFTKANLPSSAVAQAAEPEPAEAEAAEAPEAVEEESK